MKRESLTPRQRWRAALRGEPVDRLPFWPKIDTAYVRAQSAPFSTMSPEALHNWIGSDKHLWLPVGLRETRRTTAVEHREEGSARRTIYRTPHGDMELVCTFDEPTQSCHPVRFPVQTVDDVRRMTEWFEDVTVEPDPAGLAEARARARAIGEDGVTAVGIGESPLMHWVEWLAGLETAQYLLADCPGEVEALFAATHRILRRRAELLAVESPAEMLYMVENTSTTLISPAQYRRYCAPPLSEYARIVNEAGRIPVLHMCGHLKALLPDLAGVPARAFEAFTSPPVGNTTLLDGRQACPETCLIGGTNAVLWTRPAGEIIREIQRDLNALPHHRGIVVTSAGVMPPLCPPETIRQVCQWVQAYPARTSVPREGG